MNKNNNILTSYETIRKILDLAVADERLEKAVKVLDDYANQLAEEMSIEFMEWQQRWYPANGTIVGDQVWFTIKEIFQKYLAGRNKATEKKDT